MQDHKKCYFGATQSRSLPNLYREVNSRYHAEESMEHKHCHRPAQVKRILILSMIRTQTPISSRVDMMPTTPPEIQGTRPQKTRTTAEIRDGDGVSGWPATAAAGNYCNQTGKLTISLHRCLGSSSSPGQAPVGDISEANEREQDQRTERCSHA